MNTKQCSCCKKQKIKSDFSSNVSNNDGLQYHCRACTSRIKKEAHVTKDNLVSIIYNSQKTSSRLRGHAMPCYTQQQLRCWLYSQSLFHRLYSVWVQSKRESLLKPSVDRLNDYLPYSFGNIQLMTWGENKAKGYREKRAGINNKNSRAVIATNIETGVETRYYSIHQAVREGGFNAGNVCYACQGKFKSSKGHYWRYDA